MCRQGTDNSRGAPLLSERIMKKYLRLLLLVLSLSFCNNLYGSTGNLSLYVFVTGDAALGAGPGDSLSFEIIYYWTGDGPANNVQIKQHLPSGLNLISAFPSPTRTGNELTWNEGTIEENTSGHIVVSTIIDHNLSIGTVLTGIVEITADVIDTRPDDNTSALYVTLLNTAIPDLFLVPSEFPEIQYEKDITKSFKVTYFNFSNTYAENVVITDSLPEGLEYVSASPIPSLIEGHTLYWNIARIDKFGDGTITINLKPTITGTLINKVSISCPVGDKDLNNNTVVFTSDVVTVLQPIIFKPAIRTDDDPIILPSNPIFEGVAKAGAKVTLYEGDSLEMSMMDFSFLHPVELGSAVAGSDRKWRIQLSGLSANKVYYLYIRAEYNGEASNPFGYYWMPYKMRIEPALDLAGFDMDSFEVQNGEQTFHPGALGTSTSGTPNADIRIVKRFKAPPEILTDHSMWEAHKMKLVITQNGKTWEEWLPVSEVLPVAGQTSSGYNQYDFVYVHEGFEPGTKIEVWFLPSYYDENGLLITGLVWVKCHKILIDPAGYVYDVDLAGSEFEWPEIPPAKSLIGSATVTCVVRSGDEKWNRWNAEETGQVNPQVTDETTEDKVKVKGYFAFYVPSGQYKVTAVAPGYAEYTSPILTVVEAPVFHNVGMKKISAVTDVKNFINIKRNPERYVLDQNYPNPFNPSTVINYSLPKDGFVELRVFDVLGREVTTLVNEEKKAGTYKMTFNAAHLSSGIYFYRLKTGKFSETKKFILLK